MINYEDALAKARTMKAEITKCYETPTAYLFKNKDDEYSFGGEGICVILKENGKPMGLTAFYSSEYSKYDEDACKEYDVT